MLEHKVTEKVHLREEKRQEIKVSQEATEKYTSTKISFTYAN